MSAEDLRGRLEDLPLTPLTERRVDILRLLGKGNSFEEVSLQYADQNNEVDVRNELREIYAAFGVKSETSAVVHALNIGLLKTEELVEGDFDWGLFETLKDKEVAILEVFTHARGRSLTEGEFNALGIEAAQDPKSYVDHSITKSYEGLGLRNKTEAVVYYYAWRERQQRGENSSVAKKPVLTDREKRILAMLSLGISWTEIGESFKNPIKGLSAKKYYSPRICVKLGVDSLDEAISRAREMGILKS